MGTWPEAYWLQPKTLHVIRLLRELAVVGSLEIWIFLQIGSRLLIPGLLDHDLLVHKHSIIHLKGSHD